MIIMSKLNLRLHILYLMMFLLMNTNFLFLFISITWSSNRVWKDNRQFCCRDLATVFKVNNKIYSFISCLKIELLKKGWPTLQSASSFKRVFSERNKSECPSYISKPAFAFAVKRCKNGDSRCINISTMSINDYSIYFWCCFRAESLRLKVKN